MSRVSKPFKDFTLAERKAHYERVRTKYPAHIPVIMRPHESFSLEKPIPEKYLIPHDATFGQLMITLRERIQVGKEFALFLFVEDENHALTLETCSKLMSQVHKEHAHSDQFVYVRFASENTFG